MKEKQNSSIQKQKCQLKNSFKQTIKRIQFRALKQEFQKRKQVSLRNKLRDDWLQRIKIIPPRLTSEDKQNFFKTTDSFFNRQIYLNLHKHDYNKKNSLKSNKQLLFHKYTFLNLQRPFMIPRQSIRQRKSYNQNEQLNSIKNKIEVIRLRKLKQNWKLAYRKDQMNVLRFSGTNSKQNKMIQVSRFASVAEDNSQFIDMAPKVMYKRLEIQQEENKQNIIEQKIQQKKDEIKIDKKEDKKFRTNLKRGKTSLIIKRPLML